MALGNDSRGWIMTCVSGVACVFGASIICVDLIIQLFPRGRNFHIQDSNTFLASSLSLSFGVMLFSSLSNMYPEAETYLQQGAMSESTAAYVTVGCFLGGALCIAVVSRILHHYIPSHVVDCDHAHDEDDADDDRHFKSHAHAKSPAYDPSSNGTVSETSLLLPDKNGGFGNVSTQRSVSEGHDMVQRANAPLLSAPASRRPSLQPRHKSRVASLMTGAKHACDEGGPCFGYTDLCGSECMKVLNRSPTRSLTRNPRKASLRPTWILRSSTTMSRVRPRTTFAPIVDEESIASTSPTQKRSSSLGASETSAEASLGEIRETRPPTGDAERSTADTNHHQHQHGDTDDHEEEAEAVTTKTNDTSHHHHVPSNAFLSIGLQTSIAIALHKLPEGFITYATNHANPTLGFSVFMALFIHNITEGFAMALPLYLALHSRWRAMLWSSLLGGISQPLGAGVAAAWFKIAGNTDMKPGDVVYGCMFAVTAGIMACVALQLFTESLTLIHNRNVCTMFAFVGMGVLGVSHALTASSSSSSSLSTTASKS